MYVRVCIHTHTHTHTCLLRSLFSFAWCIRFKLLACAFKAPKYSEADFISIINVCCHFSFLLSKCAFFARSLTPAACFLLGFFYVRNSLLLYYLEETNYITPNTSKLLQNH